MLEQLQEKLESLISRYELGLGLKFKGYAFFTIDDLGDILKTQIEDSPVLFVQTINDVFSKFGAEFYSIVAGNVLIRKLAAPAAESNLPTHTLNGGLFEPVEEQTADDGRWLEVPGTGGEFINFSDLKAAVKAIFDDGVYHKAIKATGFAYVQKKRIKHEIMDANRYNENLGSPFTFLQALLYKAAADAAHELGYKLIGDTTSCFIIRPVLSAVPVKAIVSDSSDGTGESSCGNMRSSDPLECCASDINHDKEITIVNDGDNNWSVTGQPEGSVTWGIDPLYALAGFLNRSDVTRFMDRSGTNETAMLQLNYREPKRLPANGECIWVFKPKRNTGPRQNSYTRDTDGIPLLTLSLNGREWCASDILVVQPSPHDKPRYFTRIYPEVREGDTVFAEVYPGSFRIAAMHNGVLSFSSVSFTPSSPDEVVSIGVLKDPLVLGVEIDKQDFESIISGRVFSGHSK